MVLRRTGSPVYYTNFVFRGQRVRRATGTPDKELAEQFEARLKRQMWAERELGEKPQRSWKEAIVKYARYKAHKRTIDQDIDRLAKLTPSFESVPLHLITNALVNSAIDAYSARSYAANGRKWAENRGLTPASRNRYRAVVQHLLNLAADEWGWLERAPKLKLEPEPREEARWLTPLEADTLLGACTGLRAHWHGPIALALATGLRANNIFGLRWSRVDAPRRMLLIPRAKAKAGRSIAVPLNDYAISVLETERAAHGPAASEFVFLYRGKPFTRICPARFGEACADLGIEGATFHSLRHTWAAWHIMAGTPLYDLMVMGGWTSLEMLSLTYGHLSVAHLAESAQRIVNTKLVTTALQAPRESAVTT